METEVCTYVFSDGAPEFIGEQAQVVDVEYGSEFISGQERRVQYLRNWTTLRIRVTVHARARGRTGERAHGRAGARARARQRVGGGVSNRATHGLECAHTCGCSRGMRT